MVLPVNPQALAKLDTVPSQAFPLFIQETSGDGRTLVLRGRSLPYRGVSWPSELRVNIKYFPGNPTGQAQVLGPSWLPTEMNGMWKDSFLFNDDSRVTLLGFPNVGSAGRPGSTQFGGKSFQSGGSIPGNIGEARRARTVRDAFYILQRAGQLLRVEWGSLVRYGFLREFDPNHDREEDIRWSAKFEWIGDTAAAPKLRLLPKFDAPGLLAAILAAVQAFLNAINAALAQIFGAVQLITQRITKIGSLIAGFIEALNSLISLVFVPAEMFGVLKQQLTGIILAVKDLLDTIRSIPAAYGAQKEGGSPTDVNLAAAAAQAIAFNAAKLGVEAATTRDQLGDLASPDLLGTFTSPDEVTLRDVATQFYGAPDNWTRIADFNGLAGSVVPRGTVLRIPRLTQGA